jgi:hypothetical protein
MENTKPKIDKNIILSSIFSIGYIIFILLLTFLDNSKSYELPKGLTSYKLLYSVYNYDAEYKRDKLIDLPPGTRQFLGFNIPENTYRVDISSRCNEDLVSETKVRLRETKETSFQNYPDYDTSTYYEDFDTSTNSPKVIEVYVQKPTNEYYTYDFVSNTRTPIECKKEFDVYNSGRYISPDGRVNLNPGFDFNYENSSQYSTLDYELVFPYLGEKTISNYTNYQNYKNKFYLNGNFIDIDDSKIIFNPYNYENTLILNTFTVVGWVK